MTTKLILFVALSLIFQSAQAQTLGPQTLELQFSYTAEFESDRDVDGDGFENDDRSLANLHLSHMFGIFHSPTLVKRYGVSNKIGGIGAPRMPAKISVLSRQEIGTRVRIHYKASGFLLLHSTAAKRALRNKALLVPLPRDLNAIYDKKCTDDHYASFADYWYFYDPFRKGCEQLGREPLASMVAITVSAAVRRVLDEDFRLDLLKGNNDNGDLLNIAIVQGFADDANARSDEGRVNFKAINKFLKKEGFEENILRGNTNRPMHVFKKDVVLDSGKQITIQIKHLLVETGAEAKGTTFAKFFRQAAEQADVLVYSGHSGLGGNLDIATIERKAGAFDFNLRKRQVLFFDSCASYSYYLHSFREEKTRAKIDLLSYALSSYFDTGPDVLESFLAPLISTQSKAIKWMDLMKDMEKPLKGSSYLLNVGGI